MGISLLFLSCMGRWGEGKRNVCLFMCSCTHVQRLEEDVGALLNHLLPDSFKTGSLTETGACLFQLDWLVPPPSLLCQGYWCAWI